MQFKLDLDIVCTVNLENSSHACQRFVGNMGMSHKQRLVLQLLFSFNKTNPLKQKEKEPLISTGNTQKGRAGRNERTAYSCIISALHMIRGLLISVSSGESRNQNWERRCLE